MSFVIVFKNSDVRHAQGESLEDALAQLGRRASDVLVATRALEWGRHE